MCELNRGANVCFPTKCEFIEDILELSVLAQYQAEEDSENSCSLAAQLSLSPL